MTTQTEAKVINALLENKDMVSIMGVEGIDEMFVTHGDMWTAIKNYYHKHRSLPSVNLLRERFPDLQVVDVDGETGYYVDELRSEYIRSQIESMLLRASSDLDVDSPSRIVDEIARKVSKLQRLQGSVRDIDAVDVASAIEHMEHVKAAVDERGGIFGIPTGIKTIDTFYNTGMAPGHFINIIGWPAKGKSFISALIAANAWRAGFKPMIVSLEMSPEMVRERVYAIMASGIFSIRDFTRGAVNMDDFRTWAKKELDGQQSFIIVANEGRGEMTPNAVQAKIDQYRPDLVILDYHQLFMDNAKSRDPVERAKAASTEFKRLATSNNIPVIDIVAATSKDVSDREDPPMMAQVAWSRQLEYDADLAIAVHRHSESGLIEIVSRKNRHGDDFALMLEADIDRGIFNETFDS